MVILLWLILLVLAWPIALIALVLYPLVWILLLPFRLVGITVTGVLDALRAVVLLPARLLGGPAEGECDRPARTLRRSNRRRDGRTTRGSDPCRRPTRTR